LKILSCDWLDDRHISPVTSYGSIDSDNSFWTRVYTPKQAEETVPVMASLMSLELLQTDVRSWYVESDINPCDQ